MNFWLDRRKTITFSVFELGLRGEKIYLFTRVYPTGTTTIDRTVEWTANYQARPAGYDILSSDGTVLASQTFHTKINLVPGDTLAIIFPEQVFA